MKLKLFISKNDSELTDLQTYCSQAGIELTAKSFLQFEPNDFSIDREYQVVFFSSPRSVLFYNAKYSIPTNVRIACVGSKTREIIESLGKKVDFEGASSDSNTVALKFKTWCGESTVLFPLSNISKKTVSNHFDEAAKIEVIAYKTSIGSFPIGKHDYYVFTSPSNVTGFLNGENEIGNAVVFAWGTSTQTKLEKLGLQPILLKESSVKELIKTLKKRLG